MSACISTPTPTATSLPTERAGLGRTITPTHEAHLTPTATTAADLRPTSTLPVVPSPTAQPNPITEQSLVDLAPLHTFADSADGVTDVVFSPNSSIVAASYLDGTARLWQVREGLQLPSLTGHSAPVRSLSFSPDGALLATGSDDELVRIWKVSNGEPVRTIETRLVGRAIEVSFSPDGSLVAIGGHKCFLSLRRTLNGSLRRTFQQPECFHKQGGPVEFWGLAFAPDGKHIVTGEGRARGGGGSLQIWAFEESGPPRLITGYALKVRALDISPDGATLALAQVGSEQIWLIDIRDGTLAKTLEGHTYRVNDVCYSPDGRLLASAGRDASVRLWQPETGELLHSLESHQEAINSLAFAPDGSLMASGSDDGSVIIWGIKPPYEAPP